MTGLRPQGPAQPQGRSRPLRHRTVGTAVLAVQRSACWRPGCPVKAAPPMGPAELPPLTSNTWGEEGRTSEGWRHPPTPTGCRYNSGADSGKGWLVRSHADTCCSQIKFFLQQNKLGSSIGTVSPPPPDGMPIWATGPRVHLSLRRPCRLNPGPGVDNDIYQ